MVNTLLFDLDGTLLPFDLEVFMHGYFRKLVPQIAHLVDPKAIVGQIMQATKEMIENESYDMTNLEAFKRAFFRLVDVKEEQIWPIFDQFYTEQFAELKELTEPSPISREICRTALSKGYQLVLATNPIFPDEAVRHRMEWAGIGDIPFALITTMEHMHFCKPNPKYYLEILERIDRGPQECIMVGNDVQEDGVAGKVGMQTFLVTDFVVDRGVGHLEFDYQGSLADVLKYAQGLPDLASAVRSGS